MYYLHWTHQVLKTIHSNFTLCRCCCLIWYLSYFLYWCTDPAKIAEFQPEYIVGLEQSVTLNCNAEGNPPPTHTWTPCGSEQVCDKSTLNIPQVLNDTSYTCRVANVHGHDSKTANVCKLHCSCALYICSFTQSYTNMLFQFGAQSCSRGSPVRL